MNLRQLKRLVNETVRNEQRKSRKGRKNNWKRTINETRRLVEKFNSEEIPLKLSDTDVNTAKDVVKSGDGDKDKVTVQPVSGVSVKEVYPSQNTMHLGKAIGFMMGMINVTMWDTDGGTTGGIGGDMGAFISVGGSKKYLLDGHHRWIATAMADSGATIGGIGIDQPPAEAIATMNTMTAGLMGHNKGKGGSGGFDQFTDEAIIKTAIEKCFKGELQDDKGRTVKVPNEWSNGKALLADWTGTDPNAEDSVVADAAAKKIRDNLKLVPGAKPSAVYGQAPGRSDMPVADDADHAAASGGASTIGSGSGARDKISDKLNKGEVNVQVESINLQRWSKLAGILKD